MLMGACREIISGEIIAYNHAGEGVTRHWQGDSDGGRSSCVYLHHLPNPNTLPLPLHCCLLQDLRNFQPLWQMNNYWDDKSNLKFLEKFHVQNRHLHIPVRNKSLIWFTWSQVSALCQCWDGVYSALSISAVWPCTMLSYTNQELWIPYQNCLCKEMGNHFSGFWKLLVDAKSCQASHHNEYDYDPASLFPSLHGRKKLSITNKEKTSIYWACHLQVYRFMQ